MRHLAAIVVMLGLTAYLTASLGGCVEKDEPTGADGAKYLGFIAGETRTYADGDLEETHTLADSNVGSEDGVTVDLLAKDNGGFVVQARSLTVEVTPTTSFLRRFNDCVNPCQEATDPIAFLDWPLEAGAQQETTTEVVLTQNGAETGREEQEHTVIVGDEADVTVPAGTFSAFSVTWTVKVGDDIETNVLALAPDEGIVKWQTPDGKTLERK